MARRTDQPHDPTGAHHAACAELARETGADVGDVVDTWDACATTRAYDIDRATAERLALDDVRDIYQRRKP
jgi:esterase/lipase superfamily enzyme